MVERDGKSSGSDMDLSSFRHVDKVCVGRRYSSEPPPPVSVQPGVPSPESAHASRPQGRSRDVFSEVSPPSSSSSSEEINPLLLQQGHPWRDGLPSNDNFKKEAEDNIEKTKENEGKEHKNSSCVQTKVHPSVEGGTGHLDVNLGKPNKRYQNNAPDLSDMHATNTEKSCLRCMSPSERSHGHGVPTAPPFIGALPNDEINFGVSKSRTINAQCSTILDHCDLKSCSSSRSVKERTFYKCRRVTPFDINASYPTSAPQKLPTFHSSCLGPWHSMIAYEACVRLCIHSWARGCIEASNFLANECAVLRSSFGLQKILLESEYELLRMHSSEVVSESTLAQPRKLLGKMKVQVCRVKATLNKSSECNLSSSNPSFENVMSNFMSSVSLGWQSIGNFQVLPHVHSKNSVSNWILAYMRAGAVHIQEMCRLLKNGAENYSCLLKLKTMSEDDAIPMQPGCSEAQVFAPNSFDDDLIIKVYKSNGTLLGIVLIHVASIMEDPGDRFHWWPIFHEPEHECVGQIQLSISFTNIFVENKSMCVPVSEIVAYDIILETAMKVQLFGQRNLLLQGSWKWLLIEFASYYGISDTYSSLSYLSYVMDVATPTAECLHLVHDLLSPVLTSRIKGTVSHLENHILGGIKEQVEQILSVVFENYKSLDESSPSGMAKPYLITTGFAAPALKPALELYRCLHDVSFPEAQHKLCGYLQTAAKKRSKMHLAGIDDVIKGSSGEIFNCSYSLSCAYKKMTEICFSIRNEILTDIQIHNELIFPCFVDLPNLSAAIHSVELCRRLQRFLARCPPPAPSPSIVELLVAASDFQTDVSLNWKLRPVKEGLDAKNLFHSYITQWIQDKRQALLQFCKLNTVSPSGTRTPHWTSPFIDEMYCQLEQVLIEYEGIICCWPEYVLFLEKAIVDVEKAMVDSLEKQHADVLVLLKGGNIPKIPGLKHLQKLARCGRLDYSAAVPDEFGIFMNTMKRMVTVLRPKVEHRLRLWGSSIDSDKCNPNMGQHLDEVTVLLKTKFRIYLHTFVRKLVVDSRGQDTTNLKKIIGDSKDIKLDSEAQRKLGHLRNHLIKTLNHLHTIFEPGIYVEVCRKLWDQMGQEVFHFLENRKESSSPWHVAMRAAVVVLDDTFASQMQHLLGKLLQHKDVKPPGSIKDLHSVLCMTA